MIDDTTIVSCLTNAGKKILTQTQYGNAITFTRMKIGDGFLSNDYQDAIDEAKKLKDVINLVQTLPIYSKTDINSETVKITAMVNPAETGYSYREIGLFAIDPETNQEILYAYGNKGNKASFIASNNSNLIIEDEASMIVNVTDSANVKIVIDKNLNIDAQPYDSTKNYSKTQWVTDIIDNKKSIFESLIDNNQGNPLTDTTKWKKVSLGGAGLEVCDIGMSLHVDESKGLRRRLNGSDLAITENVQGFLVKLKKIALESPSILAKSLNEWETIKAMSLEGQCGKFFIDEEEGYIRLPRVVKVQGCLNLANLSEIVDAGVPNIKAGNYGYPVGTGEEVGEHKDGAMTDTLSLYANVQGGNTFAKHRLRINASDSSSLYRDDFDNVQEEAIQYPYFIQIATGVEYEVDITNKIELNNPYSFGDSKYSPMELDNLSWAIGGGVLPKGDYPGVYDWALIKVNQGETNFKGKTGYAYTDQINGGTVYISTPNPIINQTIYFKKDNIQYIDGYIEEITDTGFTYTNIKDNLITVVRNTTKDTTDWICDYDFVVDTEEETLTLPLLDGTESLPGDNPIIVKSSNFATDEKFVASKNGVFTFQGKGNNTQFEGQLWINNLTSGTRNNITLPNTLYGAVNVEVKKGDVISISYADLTPTQLKFSANKGNGKLYWYVGETVQNANLINAGRFAEQINNLKIKVKNIASKLSPDYIGESYHFSTQINLVQQVPFDCYLRAQTTANSLIGIETCSANGEHYTYLVDTNIKGYTWTPMVKKNTYIKIFRLNDATNFELYGFRASGGMTYENL